MVADEEMGQAQSLLQFLNEILFSPRYIHRYEMREKKQNKTKQNKKCKRIF